MLGYAALPSYRSNAGYVLYESRYQAGRLHWTGSTSLQVRRSHESHRREVQPRLVIGMSDMRDNSVSRPIVARHVGRQKLPSERW
jgi:hypothetical protein